jgi:hypothetical protein
MAPHAQPPEKGVGIGESSFGWESVEGINNDSIASSSGYLPLGVESERTAIHAWNLPGCVVLKTPDSSSPGISPASANSISSKTG